MGSDWLQVVNTVTRATADPCSACSPAGGTLTPCSYFCSLGSCCLGHGEMLSYKGVDKREAKG